MQCTHFKTPHCIFKGYVSCAWGVSNVGHVLILYYSCDAICSYAIGLFVVQKRWIIFTTAALINASLIVVLFIWTPDSSEAWVFFVIAALWGVADSVWQTQINGRSVNLLSS